MSAGHTPGPWKVFAVFADSEVRDSDDNLIAALPSKTGARYARLIASAPDLLAALRDCVLVMKHDLKGLEAIQPELRGALAAIFKATGETP